MSLLRFLWSTLRAWLRYRKATPQGDPADLDVPPEKRKPWHGRDR